MPAQPAGLISDDDWRTVTPVDAVRVVFIAASQPKCTLASALAMTLRAAARVGDREFSPSHEPMLHGEKGGCRPAGHPDLGVGVLQVAISGLDRDPERPRDLLRLQSACEQRDDLDLAISQPRGPAE